MARLLSVNVGLPREIEWKGRAVRTAIWKQPVGGRVRAGRLNLDGDGQGDLAGHGGEQRAVFVYQIESYRHWQEQLKRTDFVHGQFGENFTIEGIVGRRRLHWRPLSDRQRIVRGHATSRHLLSRRHSDERAQDACIADLQRTARILLSRPAPHSPIDDADTGPLVSFARSGIAAHWKAAAYQSILELAEACDVSVRWSCQTGVYHNCESGLVSGAVVYRPEPLEKPRR